MGNGSSNSSAQILVSADGYFAELVKEGFKQRKLAVSPEVEVYLVGLLNHYLDARNLFEGDPNENGPKRIKTLAELYLLAQNSEPAIRFELFKKLGDRTLYMSGFFGESLQRKLVDVDYYAEMGCVAYAALAHQTRDAAARVYGVFSKRFLDFVDVLSYISESSQVHNDQNILRLYDRYIKTGSELAREKLIEVGIVTLPRDQSKSTKQQ